MARFGAKIQIGAIPALKDCFLFTYFFTPKFSIRSGVDVVSLIEKAPLIGDTLKDNSIATGASTFALSYAIHKVFAPVRISITLGSVPFIVRYLRARGILKAK